MSIKDTRIYECALLSAFLLLSGCIVVDDAVIEPAFWPNPHDPRGILVSQSYMKEVVDDSGRRWIMPGTDSNSIYRADSDGKNILEVELKKPAIDISAGAGFVWVIPSNFDADAKLVWLTPSSAAFSGTDRVHRIDPEIGKVNGVVSLPVPFNVVNMMVGHEYVWIYGRKQVGFFNFSHLFVATKIDATSLEIRTYEVPNTIPLKDGEEIRQLIEPELLLINEAGFLLLAVWPKDAGPAGRRTVVKLDLDTVEYSELSWPLKYEEWCPQGQVVLLTETGISDFGADSSEISCQ